MPFVLLSELLIHILVSRHIHSSNGFPHGAEHRNINALFIFNGSADERVANESVYTLSRLLLDTEVDAIDMIPEEVPELGLPELVVKYAKVSLRCDQTE